MTRLRTLFRSLARVFTAPEPTAYIPPSPQDRPAAPTAMQLSGVRL